MFKKLMMIAITMTFLAACSSEKKPETTKEKDVAVKPAKSLSLSKKSTISNQTKPKAEKRVSRDIESKSPSQGGIKVSGKIAKGEKIRPFNCKASDGSKISTEDYKGKYLLIDFWASWCPPCRKEIPYITKLAKQYEENEKFEILGISLDRNIQNMTTFMKKNNMTWSNVFDADNGNISAQYGVKSIPFTVLIDPQGEVIATNLRGSSMIREIEGRLGS